MKCEDCPYFWWDDEYDRKMCQYPEDDPWPAPCEQEEIDNEMDLDNEW